MDLDNTVYGLDSCTIDLCLSLCDWTPFKSTRTAIKLHMLSDSRCAIRACIHISEGKLYSVKVIDLRTFEADAFYATGRPRTMDHGYLEFTRLYAQYQTAVSW